MCTAIKYKNNYFGRNLDLEFELPGTKIVLTPRNYEFTLSSNKKAVNTKYAIIGMGMVINKYPLYYDGMNEKGLFMSGLYFLGYAKYFDNDISKNNISPFEFVPYILGFCASVKDAREKLNNINLVNISFSKELPLTPMH